MYTPIACTNAARRYSPTTMWYYSIKQKLLALIIVLPFYQVVVAVLCHVSGICTRKKTMIIVISNRIAVFPVFGYFPPT